ncbi:importin-5-like [Mizuhopecten yessoensis]|uniref:Importin-5 n=1 Tax=Mizuhopecten yessoensis TaxID=6573 RepID=A0A210QEH5_MIZYE|nr:importin-5-like [Mizuhopecten yessoensis]OWF47177.1 Importin-5 [Mizuhopecten yessoensis]
MADQAQFEALLESLMSTDNDVRTQSEESYDKIPPATKIPFLVQSMKNSNGSIETRTMSAVLLRRQFSCSFDECWPSLADEMKALIKEQMMIAIREELTPPVRRKICDATAELARNMIDDDENVTWPEILKFLFECASHEDSGLRESALHIFTNVPGIFGNQQTHYLDVIKQMLNSNLHDADHPQVRFEAVKATTAFLVANDKQQSILAHFRDLLPAILQAMVDSVNAQDDDSLLKCLIELAETVPKYLRSQLDNIIPFCLKIVSDANLDDSWRQLGMEAIVTLSETAPAMVRKFSKFMSLLVPQILALMVDLEEETDWALQDEPEEEDTESNAISAESALDRLACALGGKTTLPHILANIPQMLQNNDWRYRHAALMAISACGEGCHQQMEIMLGNVVEAILPFLKDPHPRVRYAACNAIGQISTDFGPILQKKFHEKVVPSLLMVMDDDANPRVQAHGAAALVNFSEDCPKTILVQYLDVIILKLEQVLVSKFKELMEKGTKMVLEQVVTTLASVADTAEEKFIQYYDRFMPSLKYIVQQAIQPELRLLRGKTIECISLIGLAVGKDKFLQDCSEVMQLLLKSQTDQQDLADDDPQISYMISAWARMCKILGKEFQQYLPLVIGPVLKAASLKPEVALLESEEMKEMYSDQDWQFVTVGDQQSFGIRTAGLEEKATACQMLVCYARELKEAFAEYAEQVVKIMVPLLKFYFHDDIRIAASESLPFLIDCAKIRGEQYVAEMWQYICPHLLKAIEIEPEQSVLPEHMNSLAKCIEKLGKGCLTMENLNLLTQLVDKQLQEHFKKQDERQVKRVDEDYDEDVEDELMDEDDEDVYILSKIADIIHALFGTHKEEFLPIFEQLMGYFVRLLGAERPWPDKQWGLCIWDDVVEHCGPHSVKYQEYFLQSMMTYLTEKSAEVRQAAAYGVGVMAQFGGDVYAQACAEAIPLLLKMIQDPESRAVENVNPTENAISAVTKICKYNSSRINLNEILGAWITWLPVWEDEDEAAHIYGYLCDLIEINHPVILGENNKNLPQIVCIIGEALHKEAVSSEEDVFQRLLNIVRQVQSNPELFQVCVQLLTQDQQQALSEALTAAQS